MDTEIFVLKKEDSISPDGEVETRKLLWKDKYKGVHGTIFRQLQDGSRVHVLSVGDQRRPFAVGLGTSNSAVRIDSIPSYMCPGGAVTEGGWFEKEEKVHTYVLNPCPANMGRKHSEFNAPEELSEGMTGWLKTGDPANPLYFEGGETTGELGQLPNDWRAGRTVSRFSVGEPAIVTSEVHVQSWSDADHRALDPSYETTKDLVKEVEEFRKLIATSGDSAVKSEA